MASERKVADYKSDLKPIWCPGCGDYSILGSFFKAMVANDKDPMSTVVVSGIGCSGRFPYFVGSYGFHGVHGRAIPTAVGVKTANPDLTVFAVGGDGDGMGIGGGHLPHVARKNVDITYILIDNSIYGLTKGQSSPTSPLDMTSKTAPYGYVEEPLNPAAMFLAYNTSFFAKAYSGKPKEVTEIMTKAIAHKGFSVVLAFSPCVTMNRFVTKDTMKEIVKPLPEDHDTSNKLGALEKALDTESFWTGVYYQEERTTLHERLDEIPERVGRYKNLEELMLRFK